MSYEEDGFMWCDACDALFHEDYSWGTEDTCYCCPACYLVYRDRCSALRAPSADDRAGMITTLIESGASYSITRPAHDATKRARKEAADLIGKWLNS